MNDISQSLEGKNYLRFIFLNLLISGFIIITYIYNAEVFGSISTIFIENQKIFLHFGLTLSLFSFFSVLAGSIHGFIDGFLAEFLYQVAFYQEIYLEWCLIVGILGFLIGLYKYEPLKYHEGIKVYYTFLLLVINSLLDVPDISETELKVRYRRMLEEREIPLPEELMDHISKFVV